MAMRKTLFSISGLATELGKDRRTIAAALSSVPADGKKGAHPAWHLQTALDAMRPKSRPLDETFVGILLDRLASWEEVSGRDTSAARFPIDEAAELLGVDSDAVLTWLRAGMPYSAEGEWQTGDGFEIVLPWVIDWTVMVHGMAVHQGADVAAQRLRLP